VDARDRSGKTALMHSANAAVAAELLLLQHGTGSGEQQHLDKRDHSGQTALICAAVSKRNDVVELLVRQQADLEARDASGRTALLIA
jgi:ankyrin repeat protein